MIKIKFFAILREMTGREEMFFELSPGSSCGEVLLSLENQFPGLLPVLSRCLVAINGSYGHPSAFLSDGDELALLPPVSGG